MNDAIKLAIDFLHCVDQRFDLAKEPHAPGVTMLDQFHAALAALRAQPANTNAPWLTKAHMLCTDHGVPQGNIEWRIDVLRELLAAQPDHSELVKNAARYLWLREQHWSDSKFAVVSNPKTAVNLGSICPSRELLDEAIDEAMAAIGETT